MTELLSIQIHAPRTSGHSPDPRVTPAPTTTSFLRLKKIDNAAQDGPGGGGGGAEGAPIAPAQFDYMPRRKAINMEFKNLTYSVSEGRKKGEYQFLIAPWGLYLSTFG